MLLIRKPQLLDRRWPLRLADQNSGPLVQRRLSRVRAYFKSYSSPGSFTACLFTVVFVAVSRSFAYLSSIKVIRFSLHSCMLNFLPPFRPCYAGEGKMSSTSSFTPCAAWNLPLLQLVSLASVSIATVQAPTSQLGPSLRLGVTLLVPCPLCIPAKPHLPLSRSGTDVNIVTMLLSMWVPHAAGVLQTRANEGEVGLTFNTFWQE